MVARILVVDDELATTRLMEEILAHEGYEVAVAHDGAEGLRQAYSFQPSLVLLDIKMPGMDGWEMLHRLREFSDVPVIMLTALGGEASTIQGLDIGADDYVTKPFRIDELKARVRATLRRASMSPGEKTPQLRFDGGQLVIDPPAHRVTVRDQVIELTPTEYKLLVYLAHNADRVMTYDQILENVWGPGYEGALDNLKYYVSRLRSKIEADPGNPRYVLTQRGVGYYLARV